MDDMPVKEANDTGPLPMVPPKAARSVGIVEPPPATLVPPLSARAPPAAGPTTLVELVRTGQRYSPPFNSAWETYCELYGTWKLDPTEYESEFLTGFVEFIGDLAMREMGGTEAGEYLMSSTKRPAEGSEAMPPAKRMAIAMLGSADEGDKTALVQKIKALQRTDPEAKNTWWTYCDKHLEGIKDPNRHDADTLQRFLEEYCGEGGAGGDGAEE